MEIIEITANNFEKYKNDLIKLNDSFLKQLDIHKERTEIHKENILKNMIRPNSPTHLLIGIDSQKKSIGMTYFNEGTGYSCGGNYIWMNSIYVKPEEQSKGYGSCFLDYVENWAKERQFTLFVSSRDVNNEKSRKLFEKQGFKQSQNISINKIL